MKGRGDVELTGQAQNHPNRWVGGSDFDPVEGKRSPLHLPFLRLIQEP